MVDTPLVVNDVTNEFVWPYCNPCDCLSMTGKIPNGLYNHGTQRTSRTSGNHPVFIPIIATKKPEETIENQPINP